MKKISLTLGLLLVWLTAAWAQQEGTQHVTLDLKDATPMELFQTIQTQTGLDFIYNVKDVSGMGKISITAHEETIRNVLEKVFDGKNILFEFQDNTIVIKPIKGNKRYVISGTVKDKQTGETLPGTNVRLKNEPNLGVVTDLEGRFTLTFNAEKIPVLSISFLGYDTQEVIVRHQKEELTVELCSAEIQMAEVVKTGY